MISQLRVLILVFLLSILAVSAVQDPEDITIDLYQTTFTEGDLIDGDIIINLSAPLDQIGRAHV